MNAKTYSFFSIGCYHEGTGMAVREIYLDSFDRAELPQFLQEKIQQLEINQLVPLDGPCLMEFPPFRAELSRCGNLPIKLRHEAVVVPYRSHGGRELDMMTKGLKPLAVFSYPSKCLLSFLNEYFDPLVARAQLISDKICEGEADDAAGTELTIVYALPSEAWRIQAYRLVKSTDRATGWDDTLERIFGSLLGYTDEQNDLWIDYRKRQGWRWGLHTLYRFVTDAEVRWIREAGYKAFPVGSSNPIRLYQPYYSQGEPIAALTALHRETLARFHAPRISLRKFSRGVSKISDTEFEVFEFAGSDLIKVNELIDGKIDIIHVPECNR